jgi:hypothetical protein
MMSNAGCYIAEVFDKGVAAHELPITATRYVGQFGQMRADATQYIYNSIWKYPMLGLLSAHVL